MRVLICGSRDTKDRELVWSVLDVELQLDVDLTVICGYDPYEPHHQGVDQLAHEWAKARGVAVCTFPAPWHRLGERAGPARNTRMLEDGKPDVAISFPGGRGTKDMMRKVEIARAGGAVVAPRYVKVEIEA